jgi:LuxR family transcriptional regulator/LuxR family quorum-sensing system transcriptional regulator CciR
VERCRETERLSELWAEALDFFHSRGIALVSYYSTGAQLEGTAHPDLAVDGFPEEWVCQYIDGALIRIDPFPELAARLARPFLWSEIGTFSDLSPDQKRYMEMRAKSDLGDGLAIEVYGPKMRTGIIGLGFGKASPALSAPQILELQCAAQMAHIRFCEITSKRRQVAELSPRELEVLRWIAQGKSNSVIADILGISRHTVDTMTRRLFEKLDVNDRVSAAVRGIGSGLVAYRDAASS